MNKKFFIGIIALSFFSFVHAQQGFDELKPWNRPNSTTQPPKTQGNSFVEPKKIDRDNLTEPLLITPNDLPPTQILPKKVPYIPAQTPVPTDPRFIKRAECVLSMNGSHYTCTYVGSNFSVTINNPLYFGNGLPNPDFMAIKNQHLSDNQNPLTGNKNSRSVIVLMDRMTNRPASGVPVAYPPVIMAQQKAGKILLGDNITPLPESLVSFHPSTGGVTGFLLQGLFDSRATNLDMPERRISLPSWQSSAPWSVRFVPSNDGGIPSIQQIFQSSAAPAALPLMPPPSSDGFGDPVGGNGDVISGGGGGLGSFSDWWAQNPLFSDNPAAYPFSLSLQIPVWKYYTRSIPPGFTPNGKAYNIYFPLNGILFAISFTDRNNDGVYEAHIVELKGDPKNPNRFHFETEFLTTAAFYQRVDELRRMQKPAKK